jgi:hypothetical protein
MVAFIELKISLRKIVADDPDQLDGAKKARRDRRVTGGAAEQAWILRFGSLDGIQRRRANNQNTHARGR